MTATTLGVVNRFARPIMTAPLARRFHEDADDTRDLKRRGTQYLETGLQERMDDRLQSQC
ncbi:MAG: hypothetical protein M3O06_04045 [Pseudomonadota bacterium]|nr:hypothetical protein [Pseudomonadota bacterium]